ncbi:MAG TPA: GntR family transcriptional regulator [Pseudonocardiaceae bacterium]
MEAQSVDRRSVQRSTKLSEQLTSILREEVLTGRVRPGERIVQSEWAERLGVSRMPVRDAVNQLCTEGILVQQQSGQVFAAQIDPDDIRDGYYLNAVLASMAARRAATRISEDELAELKQIHTKLGKAAKAGDRHEASRLNWAFHRTVNRAANSARLTALLRMTATSIPHSAFEMVDEWPDLAQADHARILDALSAHDGEEAARIMQRHIEAGSEPMLTELRQRWSDNPET